MSYDYIFVGAGPAGLTGAICATRQGKKCIVIEKKTSLSKHPRGETLRHRPILDEILGPGVMDSLTIASTTLIEYFAPEPDKLERISLTMPVPNLIFHWKEWMEAFMKQVQTLDIDLKMGAEVLDVIEEDGAAKGVIYKDAHGDQISVNGDVIFASDGHKSLIGRKYGVDYQSLNYPIIKGLMKNAAFDTPGFKFFIMPEKSLDFAPDFPPAILFLFPRDGKNCEVGLAVLTTCAETLGIPLPTPDELMRVWKQVVRKYPVFSNMLKDATVEIEEPSMIPMAGPLAQVIPNKGVVLLGDAAGFVEISGGSGLISSMESAKFWVNTIIKEQADSPQALWEDQTIEKMNRAYTSSNTYKYLQKNAESSNLNWNTMYVGLRTSEEIMKNWELVKSALDIY